MHTSGSGTTPPRRSGPSPALPTKDGRIEYNSGDAGGRSTATSASCSGLDGFKTVRPLQSNKLLNLAVNSTPPELSRGDSYPMDKLLAKLSEQQAKLKQIPDSIQFNEAESPRMATCEDLGSSASLPATPTVHTLPTPDAELRPSSATIQQESLEGDEVLRLKLQLVQAQNKISKLDQELAQSRTSRPNSVGQKAAPSRPLMNQVTRDNAWSLTEDAQSDTSETFSTSGLPKRRAIWGNTKASFSGTALHTQAAEPSPSSWLDGRAIGTGYMDHSFGTSELQRNEAISTEADLLMRSSVNRRSNRFDSRMGAPQPLGPTFAGPTSPFDPMMASISAANMGMPPGHGGMGISMFPQYQQQPIGTPLSPHASEFTSKSGWKSEASLSEAHTYLPPTEPLNYRRLLDRNVNCNWKYIVDKIVCNNDQQASIFLQQKLKVGTPEQKYEIVEAIVAQAYPLMVNRFGNFLVQRCFEHGTPEQVIKIAEAIRGNTLNLSMDPFGCHVVQKAFDSVPEDYKAIMVRELLRRIPETVIHRYACHVWQKLFELRWTESPPQIMQFVNDALRGMWHEVALGETGSLVVQNIFENCLEDDKRPCIEEVLANIDIVAHGQFGNWCIQHICEHGSPPDRSRAIDHVIRYAAEYSTDQFASKVVEKCLKIGGSDFLGRYLDRVCEGRRDRTRIPLIDIASDQYGNYLIQWILDNATPQHREVVAAHIRKHMVSLRGSKFGSRVGMLCTNHAVTTRPGHGAGPSLPGRLPGGRYSTNTYR